MRRKDPELPCGGSPRARTAQSHNARGSGQAVADHADPITLTNLRRILPEMFS